MCKVTDQLRNGLKFSLQGLRAALLYQFAVRIEVFLSAIILPLAFFLGHSAVERALMIGSWLLVFIIELLNSAVETVVDRIGPELHELSGRAKDIASAAVLMAIVNAVVIWAVIVIGRYF